MTLEQSIRKRKRESSLADAVRALDVELDELRTTLATALVEYEALLDESLGGLPAWADVDHDELRELFHTSIADQRVLIGPRAAAVVAGRLEVFVRVWVSADGAEERPDSFDDEAAAAWAAELDALADLVSMVADGGRVAAREADDKLTVALDELVAKVADERESSEPEDLKLAALRRKLRKGKVGTALLTRESEADVLEAQRRKTEDLKSAWSPLEQLAFAGAELGVEASERLRDVLQAAVEAMVRGYPELGDVASDWVSVAPLRQRKFNTPPPLPSEAREGSPSSKHDVDDAHRVTVPIEPEEIATAELTRSAEEEEHPESEPDEQSPDEDLASDAEEPPEPNAPAPPRVRVDTDAPRNAQDTPLAPASVTATMEVIAAQRQFREPTFRLTTTWAHVTAPEIALALGPPAFYVVMITSATLAYHLGLWAENPFEVWSWAMPTFFAFAVWAVGMPAFNGWRVEWAGAWPRPIVLKDHREGGFAEIGERSLVLGGNTLWFATTKTALGRWRDGSARGWSLTLEGADHELVRLASAADSARWDDSDAPCVETEPLGSWRVSEEALLHIADECVRR